MSLPFALPFDGSILPTAVALVIWTLIVWLWMYATRIPAMQQAKIDAGTIKRRHDLDGLPVSATQVADNYNHLHEQPTLFYAIVIISQMIGMTHEVHVALAWAYVLIRVLHSVWQCTINFVPVRFLLFTLGTLVLAAMTTHVAIAMLRAG
jgi:hypothetical protein